MTTGNDGAAGQAAANGVADAGDAPDDDESLVAGALTSQADFDKLILTRFSSVPLAALAQRTDWNGLTAKQEEEARLWRKRHDEELAEAEYEQKMAEIRERADRLMERLDEQERELRRKLAEVEARPIVLANGHHVRFGANGEAIDNDTGQTLEGADKIEAERKQKEKEAEEKDIDNLLMKNREAKEKVQETRDAASQDGRNLRPDQKKEQARKAQDNVDEAEAMADGIESRNKKTEADASADSILTGTDALAAFGLGASQSGRTASFAGTLDAKDSLASALQNEFTSRVAGTDGSDAPQPARSASSGNAGNKPTPQPNQ